MMGSGMGMRMWVDVRLGMLMRNGGLRVLKRWGC